jgi:hypothetical protein
MLCLEEPDARVVHVRIRGGPGKATTRGYPTAHGRRGRGASRLQLREHLQRCLHSPRRTATNAPRAGAGGTAPPVIKTGAIRTAWSGGRGSIRSRGSSLAQPPSTGWTGPRKNGKTTCFVGTPTGMFRKMPAAWGGPARCRPARDHGGRAYSAVSRGPAEVCTFGLTRQTERGGLYREQARRTTDGTSRWRSRNASSRCQESTPARRRQRSPVATHDPAGS